MTHEIRAEKARPRFGADRMAAVDGVEAVAAGYAEYLKDESRLSGGEVSRLAFPRCEADIAEFLAAMHGKGTPVTVSGARTGIVGGCVPLGGALISLEKMDRILGLRRGAASREWRVVAQPGITVKEFQRRVEDKDLRDLLKAPATADRAAAEEFLALDIAYFYPVDPTETSASLGGTVATNASGERSFRYGSTRAFVRALRVVLANGDVLALRRGEVTASPEGTFDIVLTDGARVSFALPAYRMPAVKTAAGYYAKEGMDLIDLFIGAEGTLGVVSEVEVAVLERPRNVMSLVAFFPSGEDAIDFFQDARRALKGALVFEFFDAAALDILRAKKGRDGAGSAVPALPGDARGAIFLELEFEEAELDSIFDSMDALLAKHRSSVDGTWSGIEPRDREKVRAFRHAMPESVNEMVAENKRACPAVHKMGTDMAVPDGKLREMVDYYYALLKEAGMRYAIFGHIGENHLHVNILPRTEAELERAKGIVREFARKAVALGGTVSAEHGIGKIKHPYLEILYGAEGLREMARVKKALDPRGILGRGTIFPEKLL